MCTTCATENVVTPARLGDRAAGRPQQAFANLAALRSDYPGIYTADGGFYDAVNPVTGAVGHRRLVLDQSMIMAALDDALHRRRRCSATSRATRVAGRPSCTSARAHVAVAR